jgi:hypothetical protein
MNLESHQQVDKFVDRCYRRHGSKSHVNLSQYKGGAGKTTNGIGPGTHANIVDF